MEKLSKPNEEIMFSGNMSTIHGQIAKNIGEKNKTNMT